MGNISSEIFKRDSKGQTRTWQYEVDGARWRTIAGLLDGRKVVSAWTFSVPASQHTGELQAQFEANAERARKLKRDYHERIEQIAAPRYFAPMLAEKYDPGLVREGDFAQPKLDGIRCFATSRDLRSRKGELFQSCPHIHAQLASFFERHPDVVLDGELYNHELKNNFNELASIIRKKKPTVDDLARSARDVQYHVYDLIDVGHLQTTAAERLINLAAELTDVGPSIIEVETRGVDNHDQVRSFFLKCIGEGYEGVMVRRGNAPYEQKRTFALLKYKEFSTDEYEITDIIEGIGNWSGYAKAVEFMLPNDVRTEQGERPKAGIKGPRAFAKDILDRRDELIGKAVTVRYFELTPAGIPRFPVAVDFDRSD